MKNIPDVKQGLIAVSRDCFPIALSEKRRAAVKAAYAGELYECPVTVENELDMLKAVADVKAAECNALVVFLDNFGPETSEALIARHFDGPRMFVAAAEGDGDLINGRGDATPTAGCSTAPITSVCGTSRVISPNIPWARQGISQK